MGKISIKHYLNKNVKPYKAINPQSGEEVEKYPLYYYITVRRKTIHKPSRIDVYLTEEELELYRSTEGENINTWIRNEESEILGIVKMYEEDVESNSVKSVLRLLSSRGFNSKDEYTNNLNAYIDYYGVPIQELVYESAQDKVLELCDKKREDIKELLGNYSEIVRIQLESPRKEERLRMYEKLFPNEDLRILIADHILEYASISKGGDISIYAWTLPETKEKLWLEIQSIRARTKVDYIKKLDKIKFFEEIVPVIDKACSTENRIDTHIKEIKKGYLA